MFKKKCPSYLFSKLLVNTLTKLKKLFISGNCIYDAEGEIKKEKINSIKNLAKEKNIILVNDNDVDVPGNLELDAFT